MPFDLKGTPSIQKLRTQYTLAVVYQRPKLSAKNESFQLSAFGFGRRNSRLNMAECQIKCYIKDKLKVLKKKLKKKNIIFFLKICNFFMVIVKFLRKTRPN